MRDSFRGARVGGATSYGVICAALLGALGVWGCGGATAKGAAVAENGKKVMDTEVVHEPCPIDGKGVQKLSASGNKPEILVVTEGGRETCRGIDFQRDGRIDTWVYLDGAGQMRRVESDFDRDGRVDDIIVYQSGAPVTRQQSSNLHGRLDTWHYYQGGRLAKTERDSDGDAVIDQWWEYPKDAECPMIHSDVDGDGRPDPGSTVDYCKETGYVPPERASDRKPTSPNFQTPDSAPVETENKEGPAVPGSDKPSEKPGEKPAEKKQP